MFLSLDSKGSFMYFIFRFRLHIIPFSRDLTSISLGRYERDLGQPSSFLTEYIHPVILRLTEASYRLYRFPMRASFVYVEY